MLVVKFFGQILILSPNTLRFTARWVFRHSLTAKRYFNTTVMSHTIKIGTHNGAFHCDDVLACFMLKQLPRFKDAEVVRSRTPDVLDSCDIVVDVGGEFDHQKLRYDHHQRGFNETFNSLVPEKKWLTKLSSAGLVYVHYGKDILRMIVHRLHANSGEDDELDDKRLDLLYDLVYENFIEEIDAVDNGVSAFDGEPRYLVRSTISNRVKLLNPHWNEDNSDQSYLDRFYKAMDVVGAELCQLVAYYKYSFLPARAIVKKAMEDRFDYHGSGEVVLFNEVAVPWKEHLVELESELNCDVPIKYVLYADNTEKWRIQCVPVRPDSFINRLSLPSDWCGLRDEKLSELSGIDGCVFVHINGFIGGHKNREGALKMASESLRLAKEKPILAAESQTDRTRKETQL